MMIPGTRTQRKLPNQSRQVRRLNAFNTFEQLTGQVLNAQYPIPPIPHSWAFKNGIKSKGIILLAGVWRLDNFDLCG